MDDFFDFAARGTRTLYRRKPLVANATYHVFNRRDDGAPVFFDDRDRDNFVETARRLLGPDPYRDRWGKLCLPVAGGLRLLAMSVLENHYHLVLAQIERTAMTHFMRRLMGSYTKQHNSRFGLAGPVFDERYQAKPIESTRHLRAAIAYVHANPSSPLDNRWTGHRYYLDPRLAKAVSWINVREGLDAYGSRGNYLEWFMRAVEARQHKNSL